MPDSFLRKKAVIAIIVIAIVALMGIFLFMTSEGNRSQEDQNLTASSPGAKPALGTLGAQCGGKDRLPCMPGLKCNTPQGQFATMTGVCVKDENAPTNIAKEGEECDGTAIICEPGFTCQKNGGKGTCVNMLSESKKSFIFSLIPNGAELDGGVYKAAVGTKLHITVEAVNVTGGSLYYLPLTSSKSGVDETDKVAPLTPVKDKQNNYEAYFTVQKDTLGQLVAKMQGKDGQTVSIPVTVGAK
jgi:hypothetical protein